MESETKEAIRGHYLKPHRVPFINPMIRLITGKLVAGEVQTDELGAAPKVRRSFPCRGKEEEGRICESVMYSQYPLPHFQGAVNTHFLGT
jgi:hypothetical protein